MKRRDLLKAAGAGLATVSSGMLLASCGKDRGQPAPTNPFVLPADVQTVVDWILDTPAVDVLQKAATELSNGLTEELLMLGTYAAGVSQLNSNESGYLHDCMSTHASHLLSLEVPASQRLIPLLWSVVKANSRTFAHADALAAEVADITLPVPTDATAARAEFIQAMTEFEPDRADVAITGLLRTAPEQEVVDLLLLYGGRDQEDIGHKIIHTAHGIRTLDVAGWQYGEIVARSATRAMLHMSDTPYPGGNHYDVFDYNQTLLPSITTAWESGTPDDVAVVNLVQGFRTADAATAAEAVVAALNAGVAPVSIWDAISLGAAEMLIRFPVDGWVAFALHSVTALNAQHFGYLAASDPNVRLMAMLQSAAWLPIWRDTCVNHNGENPDTNWQIDNLQPAAGTPTVDDVFDAVTTSRAQAVLEAWAYFQNGGDATAFLARYRAVTLQKTNGDWHQFKLPVAAHEEAALASPQWRSNLLAASLGFGPDPNAPDWEHWDEASTIAASFA